MSWQEKLKNTHRGLRNLNGAMPDATRAFGNLGKAVKDGSVLDFKTKEFVALGVAVAGRCEDCIALHIESLIRIGASRDEVADVLAMTIQMGGGPAMMYAAKAMNCYDELSA